MGQIPVWEAAQDVIQAEERVQFVREEIADGQRFVNYQPAAEALAQAERSLAGMRSVLASLVGADRVDAAVAERRAQVAEILAARRRA